MEPVLAVRITVAEFGARGSANPVQREEALALVAHAVELQITAGHGHFEDRFCDELVGKRPRFRRDWLHDMVPEIQEAVTFFAEEFRDLEGTPVMSVNSTFAPKLMRSISLIG